MQRKKSKTGKILLAVLGLFLVAGVAGTVTAGALTDWTFNLNDPFNDVRIEDQEFDYDGEAKTLNIFVPDGASYELTITDEEGKTVNECKDIGVYTFTYKVKIGNVTKEYIAKLTIKPEASSVNTQFVENGVHLKLASANVKAEEGATQVISYTVEPEGADGKLSLTVSWASDDSSTTDDDEWKSNKTADTYINATIDEKAKTITVINRNNYAFASQILVTITSEINPNINATIKVDYKPKFIDINNSAGLVRDQFLFGIGAINLTGHYSTSQNKVTDDVIINHEVMMNLPCFTSTSSGLTNEVNYMQFVNALRDSIAWSEGTIPNYFENNTFTQDFQIYVKNVDDIIYNLNGQWGNNTININYNFANADKTKLFNWFNNFFTASINNNKIQTFLEALGGVNSFTMVEKQFLTYATTSESNLGMMTIPVEKLYFKFGDYLEMPYKEIFKTSQNPVIVVNPNVIFDDLIQSVNLDNEGLIF